MARLSSHHRSWAYRHMSAFILDRVMTLSDHSNGPKPHHCHLVNAFEAPTGFAVTPYLHNTLHWNNILTAHWSREEKSPAIYWRGENLNRTIGFGVACFIHGTSIQNRKSNWICASDLNHWPWDCPVCDFQSKIPSSAVRGGREETSRNWKTRTEPGVKYEVLPGRSHSSRSKCILKGLIAALKPPGRTISLLWQTELLWGGQLGEIVCFYVKHATRLAIK